MCQNHQNVLDFQNDGGRQYATNRLGLYFYYRHDFSGDSHSSMESMIKEGIRLGLKTMCFTEHLDLDFPYEDIDFSLDIPKYHQTFETMREAYHSQIELLFGIELGLQPHLSEQLLEVLDKVPFDFVIGSTHLVNRTDPYYPEYFKNRSDYEAFRQYFEEVLKNIQSFPHFDTLGHLDYIVRYSPNKDENYNWTDYLDLIDPILLFLIKENISLEVNTAGLKYGLTQPNPTSGILKRYRQLGGKNITIGSDAHCPAHLAYGFSALPKILNECGFHHYNLYRNRQPYQENFISTI